MSGIRINSNVEGVIGVLARFRTGLDGAVVETVKPERWRSALRRAAVLALEPIASEGQRGLVAGFADALIVLGIDRGFVAEISEPVASENLMSRAVAGEHERTVRDYQGTERRRRRPLDMTDDAASLMDQARAVLRDWVETPESEGGKRKERWEGGQDERLGDEDIIDNLEIILFHPTPNPSEKMKTAREKLSRAIGEWWAAQGGGAVLPREELDRWLRAVLGAWRALMRRQLPVMLGQQLDELWNSSHERML